MSEEILESAKARIGEACKILQLEPAALTYLGVAEIKPTEEKGVTMRLNTADNEGSVALEYNPEFVSKIQDPSILAQLFYGEALRIALHHATHRLGAPVDCHKQASDQIVFEQKGLLSVWKPEVKEALASFPSYASIRSAVEPLGFKKDEMWSLEFLRDYLSKAQKRRQSQGGGEKKGESSSEAGGSPGAQDSSKRGAGARKKAASDAQSQALEKHFSPETAKKNTEKWGENSMADDEIRRATERIASTGEWGSMPGALQELIKAANCPKFDPTRVLRRWKQNLVSNDVYDTRSKANRRHGFERPGWRHKSTVSMIECIDASGSMSAGDIALGEGFVNKFIKRAKASYCFWDTACGEITPAKKKITQADLKSCGGGTNPQCVIDKLERERVKVGGLLFFTDCYFDWPRPASKWVKKIFIIATSDHGGKPDWCDNFLTVDDIMKWQDA